MLEPRFYRLPISGVQYEYSFFAHRYSRFVSLGKGHDDDTSTHLLHDGSPSSRESCEYPLAGVDAISTLKAPFRDCQQEIYAFANDITIPPTRSTIHL